MTLRRELTGVRSLAGADVRDGSFSCPVRNVSGHGDEVFHGLRLLLCSQALLPARLSRPGGSWSIPEDPPTGTGCDQNVRWMCVDAYPRPS